MHRSQIRTVLTAALGAAGLIACAQQAPPPAPAAPAPFYVKTTIRELMDAEVDPSADALWDAVAFNVTMKGATEQKPQTPEQWQAVRRSALTLIESTNLLIMDGRQIAPPDTPVAPGELDPASLQRKLDSSRARFTGFAQALRAVSLKALDAIDARDPQRLFDVGGEIDQVCEACHLVYWYPPEASGGPSKPTDSAAPKTP